MAKRKRSSKSRPRIGRRASQAELLLQRALSLIERDELTAALELLDQAEPTLHDNPVYHGLKGNTYARLGYYIEAVDHAQVAAGLAPDQPAFQALMAAAYQAAGYFSLAYRARRAWERLDPSFMQENPDLDRFDEAYRAVAGEIQAHMGLNSFEAVDEVSYFLDQGFWAMEHEDWYGAVLELRQALDIVPAWVPARNSLSLCLYSLGELPEAVAEAETVLADYEPDNVQALGNLVRYRLALGNDEQAQALGDRLVAQPRSENPDDAIKLVEALSILDRDGDVDRVVRRYSEHDAATPDDLLRYQGIAAANLGRREEAISLLQKAQEADPDPLIEATLEALAAGRPGRGLAGRFSPTTFLDWLPGGSADDLMRTLADGMAERQSEREGWRELAERYPQVVIALRKLLYEEYTDNEEEEEEEKEEVESILSVLSMIGTPRALAVLRTFAQGRVGKQEDRMAALRYLQVATGLGRFEPIEVWIDGAARLVQPSLQELSDEHEPDYPEEAIEVYFEAVDAHVAGDLAAAEAGYHQVLRLVPDFKEAYSNLAAIVDARGEQELADEYLQRALEIDPEYPFARFGLASRALNAGDLDKAREILQPLFARPQIHPAAFARLQRMLAWIAQAEGNFEQAQAFLETALECDPDNEELVLELAPLWLHSLMVSFEQSRRESDARYRTRRQAAQLPADPTLGDCLGLLTRGDMRGMADALGLSDVRNYNKAPLAAYFDEHFRDPLFVTSILLDLHPEELAALADVLDHNGVMGWREFATAHGDDLNERPQMEFQAGSRTTVMGRLRARGLLYEGTAGARLIVAIPRELRAAIRNVVAP